MTGRPDDAPLPHTCQHLAVLLPTWVGDSVMATPVLRLLRQQRPQMRITALARPGVDDLLKGLPFVDAIDVVQPSGVGGTFGSARKIHATGADALLLLPNSFRSGMIGWLSRIPIRLGYRRDGRGPLLTWSIAPEKQDRPSSTVTYYLHLARHVFDLADDQAIDDRLELVVTPEQREKADELLADLPRPFVLLNPGGNKPAKRWPTERFAACADRLHQEHQLAIAVTGAPAEAELVNELVDAINAPAMNLVERGITLGTLKAVIAQAAVMITNDTGPRHIAAALGTPNVSLFGPTDYRWTELHHVREHPLRAEPFLPEDLIADDHPKACAVDRIPVADVIAATTTLLRSR